MIVFQNKARLCESADEALRVLEFLINKRDVYLDFECSSGDPELAATSPWRHCTALSFACTVDDLVGCYVFDSRLIGRDVMQRCAAAILTTCERWINHNVKYDAHVAYNDLGIETPAEIVDTLDLAKIVDSDRQFKGGYGLDALSKYWIHEDISHYYHAIKVYLADSDDYASVPPDILGEYAGQDVISNRRIWRYILANTPPDCMGVHACEIELTRNVLMAERVGLQVNPTALKAQEFINLNRMNRLEEELEGITGRRFRPHVNDDVYEILCGMYGLPILKHTASWDEFEDGDDDHASFDKHALAEYQAIPYAPLNVINRIIDFRKIHTQTNFFVRPLQTKQVGGRVHPDNNLTVRTGRMSCRDPNAQQLDKLAKKLIILAPGQAFLSVDWSQIEFRTIVHYTQDAAAIKAYNDDPDTDFHQFTADMCGLHCADRYVAHDPECPTCKAGRRSAKTINFLMGYGGGKERLMIALMKEKIIVDAVLAEVAALLEKGKIRDDQRREAFEVLARQRAEGIFNLYHRKFPSLKTTSRAAEYAARQNGYVRNLAGRRRHLRDRHHIAFNTANQSSAADMMKERANAVCRMLAGTPINLVALVHDEFLFEGPEELIYDRRTHRDIIDCLEHPAIKLRVPVRCSYGASNVDWYSAGIPECKLKYDTELCENLNFARACA